MTDAALKSLSLDEIRALMEAGKLVVRSDAPEAEIAEDDDFWARAKVVARPAKKSVHLRLEPEVYDFFVTEMDGKGHIRRMQDVLAAYMRAKRAEDAAK